MPVSFNSIPSNWRMPLYWVEVDPSMAGYPTSRLISLVFGTMLSTGAAIKDVPVPVPSLADARQLFGYGSMLDGMVDYFTKNNFAQELWAIPIEEAAAGVAAHGAITVTAPATAAGTLPVYVAGRRVQVFVAAGDAIDVVATNIADAINADLSMPVIAAAAAAVITLTCKWKGVEGNDIDVRMAYGGALAAEQIPVGLAFTMPTDNKLGSGTGEVDLTQAIVNLGDEPYEFVATPYTDSTSLALLESEYGFSDTGRWGWLRQLYGHIFSARRGIAAVGDSVGYSDLLQYGPNNNSGVVSVMAIEANSPTPPWCYAAAYAAKAARALVNDPARPLQTLAMDGCLPAPKHQRFTMRMNNDFAYTGLATQAINGDGVPAIKRETTTYQVNLYGQGDDAYELVTTLATLAKLLRNQKYAITSKYPRHKLADDGTKFGPGQAIVTPGIIKAELVSEYQQDMYNGLVENLAAFKQHLIVERDPNDPNRANVLYPPDLINQLRIFAVLAQFRLQYDRGIDTQIIGQTQPPYNATSGA
jgi:phage tail sheath gpL-like